VEGISRDIRPRQEITVRARVPGTNEEKVFTTIARIDSPVEVKYYRNGGILHAVLRDMLRAEMEQA